jgi:hypothetical protein
MKSATIEKAEITQTIKEITNNLDSIDVRSGAVTIPLELKESIYAMIKEYYNNKLNDKKVELQDCMDRQMRIISVEEVVPVEVSIVRPMSTGDMYGK